MTRLAVLTAGLRRAFPSPPSPGLDLATVRPALDGPDAPPPASGTGKRKHRRRAVGDRRCAGCGRAHRARKRDGGESRE